MTSKMNAKVRFVRCPRCRQVLRESPEIPVYKCGGCGTILQAKRRKPDTIDTESLSGETCENGKREPVNVSEKIETSHVNQECNVSSERELSEDKSPTQNNLRDDNIKEARDESLFAELPVSPELSCGNQDLSSKLPQQMEQGEGKGTLSQVTGESKYEFCDGYSEWQGGRNSSDDYPSSTELTYRETENSSPEPQAQTMLDKVKISSDERTSVNRREDGNCKSKEDASSNFISKIPSLVEDKPQESDSSLICREHRAAFVSLHLQQQDNTTNECRAPENVDFCGETSSSEVTREPKKLLPAAEAHAEETTQANGHMFEILNVEDILDSVELDPTLIAESPLSEYISSDNVLSPDTQVNGHMFESLNAEDILDSVELDSTLVAESPLSEYISSDNVLSPDTQHLEPSQKVIPQYSELTSSSDSLDNLLLTNSISKLDLGHTDLTKSPMTRSYYACDSSVSSYDGIENQNPGRSTKILRRKFKHSASVKPNGSYKQDEPRVKDSLGSEAEMNYPGFLGTRVDDMLSSKHEIRQQVRSCSILQDKNHHMVNYTKHNQYNEPDPRSFFHSGARRMRGDHEEHAPRVPPVPQYSLTGQQNKIRSSGHYSGLQNYSGSCSPDAPSYAESDKMELLRMVYELKDQLKRTHLSNSRYSAGFDREKMHTPLFYGHLAPAEEMHADLHHPRYPGKCNQGKGMPRVHKMSRLAFSGSATLCRQEADCTCLYCHPQDWHCSMQLNARGTCCNSNFHSVNHNRCTFYKGHYSTSSSPQHYTGSQYSSSFCETNSIDQGQHNEMKRLHVRGIYHSSKRHLRPVAGGIPIVACFHCSELLELPADFLLLGRRCHKVRCSSCRKIMKFTLQNGRCLAPCLADTVVPPPSMVDDCRVSVYQRDLVSASHSSKCPNAELQSRSDEYGLSFDRSYSTEWNPSQNIAPSDSHKSHMRNNNRSSISSLESPEDMKMKGVLEDSQTTQEHSMEKFGSVGTSTIASKSGASTSEIMELPQPSGSPLHRLLGYSSPSQVLRT